MTFETIYQSKTLHAVWNRGADPAQSGTGPAFVTFDGLGLAKQDAPSEPFGAPLAKKLGIDIIHVIPAGSDWYHYADIDACLAAVQPHVGPDTLAYGSSMGAFAAAQFSDRLGIKRAICFSPQYSIQPTIAPFEKRWQDHAARITFLHDDTIAPRRAKLWLFADPESHEELEHVRMIAQSGPHEIIPVPHAGHPVGRALNEAKVMKPIIDMFLAGHENAADLNHLIETTYDASQTVLLARAELARGQERETLLRRANTRAPRNNNIALKLGIFLLRKGHADEAHDLLRPLFKATVKPRIASIYRRACAQAGVAPTLLDTPHTANASMRPEKRIKT